MKKILLIAQLILIPLLGTSLRGQDTIENLKERAKPLEPIILAAASTHAVDPHLLWTIAYLESGFRSRAISYKDGRPCAFGLMQFIPSTARQYGLKNPFDAREAIDAAARYVRDLLRRFDGRIELVLAAYNAGEGTVQAYHNGERLILRDGRIVNPSGIRTGGVPPYAETLAYVARGTLIYQRISRQKPLATGSDNGFVPKDAGFEPSIYVSELGSGAKRTRPQNKQAKPSETSRTLSLYAN